MRAKPIDVKAHKRVFKGASLMGPKAGPPTVVDSDQDGNIIPHPSVLLRRESRLGQQESVEDRSQRQRL